MPQTKNSPSRTDFLMILFRQGEGGFGAGNVIWHLGLDETKHLYGLGYVIKRLAFTRFKFEILVHET